MYYFNFIFFIKNICIFNMSVLTHTTLCSFWKNLSGHFERFACNHSYGYAFRQIAQTDSLRFPPKSAFL